MSDLMQAVPNGNVVAVANPAIFALICEMFSKYGFNPEGNANKLLLSDKTVARGIFTMTDNFDPAEREGYRKMEFAKWSQVVSTVKSNDNYLYMHPRLTDCGIYFNPVKTDPLGNSRPWTLVIFTKTLAKFQTWSDAQANQDDVLEREASENEAELALLESRPLDTAQEHADVPNATYNFIGM